MALNHDSQADILPLPNANAAPRARVSAASPFTRDHGPGRAPARYSCQPRLYSIRKIPECYLQYTPCQ